MNAERNPVTFIFVYGTLRANHGNHYLIQQFGAVRCGHRAILDHHALFTHYGLPFVCETAASFHVVGEVYAIDGSVAEAALEVLAQLESAYAQKHVEVQLIDEDGHPIQTLRALVYFAGIGSYIQEAMDGWVSEDTVELISDGDYDRWAFNRRIDFIEQEADDDA